MPLVSVGWSLEDNIALYSAFPTLIGIEWPGVLEIMIAGSVALQVSKETVSTLDVIRNSLASFAGPTLRSGGTKVSLSRMQLALQGVSELNLKLDCSGMELLHILDNDHSLLAGYLNCVSLTDGDMVLMDTLSFCSSPIFSAVLR